MRENKFTKNCRIIHDEKLWQCVCRDREVAIFAPVQLFNEKLEGRVKYHKMFAVDSDVNKATKYGFKFKFSE